jgi:uncharacterized protein YjdB/uncharacterized lipoprotein YddW (UPF0748 family)
VRNLLNNNGRLVALMGVLFTGIIVVTGIVAIMMGDGQIPPLFAESSTSEESSSQSSEIPTEDPEDTGEEIPAITEPVIYNKPDEMKGVWLIPGEDFLASSDNSEETVKKEIDTALANALSMKLNTVIIQTAGENGVIYNSKNLPVLTTFFDPLEYAISQARAQGMYVYCIYNTLYVGNDESMGRAAGMDASTVNFIRQEVGDFVSTYHPDGLFLDEYYNEESSASYGIYLAQGGGIGYENYMKLVSRTALETVVDTVRDKAPGMQLGILTDAVWANQSQNEAGSNTSAEFTTLYSGNADVKAFLEEGMFDFVGVKAYGSTASGTEPFDVVTAWWGKQAEANGIPMYVIHAADRMGSSGGWSSNTEMVRQMNNVRNVHGFSGSVFNSLSALLANPGGATDNIIKYLNDQTSAQFILTELKLTKPEQTTYTTNEASVVFQGASDPTNPVTLNDEEISTDENGYFSVSRDLKAGLNTFVFSHKGKTVTYKITRQVKVLDTDTVTPTGSVTVDGGMKITVSVNAYAGATVTASLGGQTITLTETKAEDDDTDKTSSYVKFSGEFTAPDATSAIQKLGNITITGSYQGFTDSATGASVTVNKKAVIGSGNPIVVSASQAETFPNNTVNDISSPYCFPLPAGALDYTLGDEIVYRDGSNTYRYYLLESGLRVYSKDIKSTSQEAGDNVIKGMSITSTSTYTDVILTMTQPVSYDASYSSTGMTFDFAYTKEVPGDLSKLTKNPLFSSATWDDTTLTLKFRKRDGMVGYKASYSGNTLTLRFNNVPTMSNARIVIDPGHSGPDGGASGNLADYPEKVVNQQIAKRLYNVLVNTYGSNVLLIDTTGSQKVELQTRVSQAESYNAQLFISIHCNSAASTSAKGSESYYFYSFSEPFSDYVNSALYSAMGNSNRGSKYGLYYVTRTSRYTSTLAECGFMSNNSEYRQLLDSTTQQSIATNLAKAISNYFDSIRSTGYPTGTESVGSVEQVAVTGVKLDKTTLTLKAGESATLTATVSPENATNQGVTWKSSDEKVAVVDADGKITAKGAGTATITVTTADGGKTATCKVTVTGTAVTGVTLNKTALTLAVGESETLKATIAPTDAANQSVNWSSDNTGVATVDASGKVTAKSAGTATITVTTADGGKTATCKVTVTGTAVTGVTLNKTTLTLTVGDSETLKATITPENAANQSVSWSSDNTGVVTVDASGKVTAKSAGTATITVTTVDGGKKATCKVTVQAGNVPVTGVSLEPSSLTLEPGGTSQLTVSVSPNNATNQSVSWSSDNTGVAKVSADGTVTAIAPGNATITVTTADGGKKATCKVTVKAGVVSVTGVSLDRKELTLAEGDSQRLGATVTPGDAANQSVSWSSKDTGVARVSADGTVTAVAPGSTTITVTTADGGYTDSCTVTVEPKAPISVAVESVSLSPEELSGSVGESYTLTWSISPPNAANQSVSWSSNDTGVAKVDASGKVTFLKAGNATITITTADGGKKATCAVTVVDAPPPPSNSASGSQEESSQP